MTGMSLRLLTLGLLACLPWGRGVASTEPEAYVQGIHIRRVNTVSFTGWSDDCSPEVLKQVYSSEEDQYFALVGGDLWRARYTRLWVPETRAISPEEYIAKIPYGKSPCGIVGINPKPLERVEISAVNRKGKTEYSRNEDGVWHGPWRISGAAILAAAGSFDYMARMRGTSWSSLYKRVGESSVLNVKCTVYAFESGGYSGERCVAEEDSLRQQGVDWLKEPIILRSRNWNPKVGGNEQIATHIDFKAKIPLSVLLPPREVMNRPAMNQPVTVEMPPPKKPAGRGPRTSPPARVDDD